MTTTNPPVEPDLAQIREWLSQVREAENAMDFEAVADLSRRALNALNITEESPARDAMQSAAFQSLIRALERLGRFDQAQDAIKLWQERTKNPESLIDLQIVRGRVLLRQGNFNKALAVLEEAVSRAEAQSYLRGMGEAYQTQANVLWALGRSEQALMLGRQALTIFRQMGDPQLQAQAHMAIAGASHYMGRFYEAIEHSRRAAHLFESLGNEYGMAVAYSNLGESYQQLYDMENALKYHQKAYEISGPQRANADLIRNLGVDMIGVGRVEEGLMYLNQALEKSRTDGERDLFFQALHSLASAHLALGNILEARRLAEELLAEAHQIDAIRHIIRATLILGHCARAEGDTVSAQEYLHEGFMAAQRASDKTIIWQTHAALADLLMDSQPAMAQVHRNIATEMVRTIAASIEDDRLRRIFQQAEPVHALLGGAD